MDLDQLAVLRRLRAAAGDVQVFEVVKREPGRNPAPVQARQGVGRVRIGYAVLRHSQTCSVALSPNRVTSSGVNSYSSTLTSKPAVRSRSG